MIIKYHSSKIEFPADYELGPFAKIFFMVCQRSVGTVN